MERAFEKGHVTQQAARARRRGVIRSAVMGQQDDRQVRPGRLATEEFEQRGHICVAQCLVSDDRQAGPHTQLSDQLGHITGYRCRVTRFVENAQSDLTVPPAWGENDRAL